MLPLGAYLVRAPLGTLPGDVLQAKGKIQELVEIQTSSPLLDLLRGLWLMQVMVRLIHRWKGISASHRLIQRLGREKLCQGHFYIAFISGLCNAGNFGIYRIDPPCGSRVFREKFWTGELIRFESAVIYRLTINQNGAAYFLPCLGVHPFLIEPCDTDVRTAADFSPHCLYNGRVPGMYRCRIRFYGN